MKIPRRFGTLWECGPTNPAPGYRGASEGALWYIGSSGYSWSSSVNGTNGVYLNSYTAGLNSSETNNRGYGFQLRCLSE
ncbi:hypothetical protein [uncultured Rikenella sp.]|uniref:hypothetical protein n=1 Tax=uncultured Rikenella sp. TaxID=368003 RepID=UPI0025FB91F9|nr:hypothetical protein [uncultured Rikenella sp.]